MIPTVKRSYTSVMFAAIATAFVLVMFACGGGGDANPSNEGVAPRHVQLVHLDGYRGDLTRALLDSGRLPNLQFLVSRGKVSYSAASVDKTETMKVVQSYLTGQTETGVVGWWQFQRDDFRFRNFWMNPAEVLGYALGLEYPERPTVLDFLSSRGENLVAGMSLARRGVPFENYGRAYMEGLDAVSSHHYLRQADVTMERFLDIHQRIAENNESSPALSTLLLAAADEYSHAYGVTRPDQDGEHCIKRGALEPEEQDQTLFRLFDEDSDPLLRPFGGALATDAGRYFTKLTRSARSGRVDEACFALPELTDPGWLESRRAHPDFVLAKIVLDIELGYLIEAFRSIRFRPDGTRYVERSLQSEAPANSLFASTLFLIFGDHGMVDTGYGMRPPAGPAEADPGAEQNDGLDEHFIEVLNRGLGLTHAGGAARIDDGEELGIEFSQMPLRLSEPDRFSSWQSDATRRTVEASEIWAQRFFSELETTLRTELHQEYWWLFFLRSLLIDPKLAESLDPVADPATGMLRRLYLRGDAEYMAAEADANRDFFDKHVRLVYGGGARNNAELFLPRCKGGSCRWDERPSYEEILAFRGGRNSRRRLLDVLRDTPGVGLIFVRRNNDAFRAGVPLPETSEIDVFDRDGNQGRIRVFFETENGARQFQYRTVRTAESSVAPGLDSGGDDPLGYGEYGNGEGTTGSYREWNDWTIDDGSAFVNVPGGIGSYLHSNNPAIGDVLVLHDDGWNFGGNLGGHGAIHRQEKLTFMLASGPTTSPGPLMAETTSRGADAGTSHHPSLIDLTPTALRYLGYEPTALDTFAEQEFEAYMRHWLSRQRDEIIEGLGGMGTTERALNQAGVDDIDWERLRPFLSQMLAFTALEAKNWSGPEPRPTERGLELILR